MKKTKQKIVRFPNRISAKEFGVQICLLRSKKGIGIDEFHKKSGITMSQLNVIEKGRSYFIKAITIMKIAKGLGISITQLMSYYKKG